MKNFIISDQHFGHQKIIEYCNRPFKSVDEMTEYLVLQHNKVVTKGDIVYMLGDFAFGSKEEIENYTNMLNGRKILIMGNHDKHPESWYRDCGFESVYRYPIIYKNFFILSHDFVYMNESMPYVNFFGHHHNNPIIPTFTENSACMCVERWDYQPQDLDKLIDKFRESKIIEKIISENKK